MITQLKYIYHNIPFHKKALANHPQQPWITYKGLLWRYHLVLSPHGLQKTLAYAREFVKPMRKPHSWRAPLVATLVPVFLRFRLRMRHSFLGIASSAFRYFYRLRKSQSIPSYAFIQLVDSISHPSNLVYSKFTRNRDPKASAIRFRRGNETFSVIRSTREITAWVVLAFCASCPCVIFLRSLSAIIRRES